MSLQEAVEAPRVFSWGQESEIATGRARLVRNKLAAMGHPLYDSPRVAAACAIGFNPDGGMTGAACWRADGHGCGLARAGTSFWPIHANAADTIS